MLRRLAELADVLRVVDLTGSALQQRLTTLGQFDGRTCGWITAAVRRGARPTSRRPGPPFSGALMSIYTGVLLLATSTPLWSAAYRHLPALFGTTATASATSALSLVLAILGTRPSTQSKLDRLAVVAGGGQLAMTLATDRVWRRRGVSAPLDTPRMASVRRLTLAAGILAPLLVHLLQVWNRSTIESSRRAGVRRHARRRFFGAGHDRLRR